MGKFFCLCCCLWLLCAPAFADGILDDLTYFGTGEDDQTVDLCRLGDGRLAVGYNARGDRPEGHLLLIDAAGEARNDRVLAGGALRALCPLGDKLALLLTDAEGVSRLRLLSGPEWTVETTWEAAFSAEDMTAVGDALVVCGSAPRAEGDTCGVVAIYSASGGMLHQFYNDVVPATGFTCVAPTDTGLAVGGWKETEAGRAALMLFYTGGLRQDSETNWAEYRVTGESVDSAGAWDAVYTRVIPCDGGAIGLGILTMEPQTAAPQALVCRVYEDGRQGWRKIAGGPRESFFTDAAAFGDSWILVGQYGDAGTEEGDDQRAWLHQLDGAGNRLVDFSISLDQHASFSAILAEGDQMWVLGQSEMDPPWEAEEWGGGGMDGFLAELSSLQKQEFQQALK